MKSCSFLEADVRLLLLPSLTVALVLTQVLMLISLHTLLWIPDEISWIVIQCTGLLLPWVLYCCQLLELDVSRSPACQLSHASRKTRDTSHYQTSAYSPLTTISDDRFTFSSAFRLVIHMLPHEACVGSTLKLCVLTCLINLIELTALSVLTASTSHKN
ncbi:hypothetical protein CHARACLAT_020242 [Characodon lateralis]|uniref:Uncharacterized protein n=1 Tax=Characodon lateralis TaxID=208331 RepID=A0ABU7CZ85_9TELE|nr:hypothetical protein [Characodon lateralis]